MLGKLFRYDMKALFRLMLPLILSVLGITLVGTASLRILIEVAGSNQFESTLNMLLVSSLGMMVFASILAIVAFAVIATVFILYRYYKNLFTDEGYLTFTLPVTPGQILFSKTASGVLWSAIVQVVVLLCVGVMLFLGVGEEAISAWEELFSLFSYYEIFDSLDSLLFVAESVASMMISLVCSVVLFYLAITIGSTVVRHHKVLCSIGIYIGIQFGLSMVSSLIEILPVMYFSADSSLLLHMTSILNLILSVGVTIGAYFGCHAILNRRLNLS